MKTIKGIYLTLSICLVACIDTERTSLIVLFACMVNLGIAVILNQKIFKHGK